MDNTKQNKDEEKKNVEYDIPFILGEETRPKIETFTNDKYSVQICKSIFYKQYCTALSGIAELVNYQSEVTRKLTKLPHNNIFIFTGDRGSGKTSCMLTVKDLLCNTENKEKYYAEFKDIKSDFRKILQVTQFRAFDMIDPIYFDCHHNILDLFMGTLFKEFQIKENKNPNNWDNECCSKRRGQDLLNLFSETKRNLSVLNKTVELSEFDDLEQLNDLAASMAFKQSLDRLVKCYIEYMYTTDTQLILCIDDIDLNMSEGYEMIEQIRKYLNIPRLIILMAIKVDQLGNVIRIKYARDFEPLLKQKSKDDCSRYDGIINEIVERYITKVFPINHRIQMPAVTYLLNQSIGIFKYDREGNLKCIDTQETLKEGILKLIYKKTRMLAYNSRSRINYIIPQNLRELLNFIHLLYNMEDALNHTEAIPNLLRFKDYFYGVWCTNNLDEDGLAFMRTTRNVLFAPKVNQMVIRMLEHRFSIFSKLKETTDMDNSIRELINILNIENIMYNISLGDVLACLDWLDKVCDKENDLKLLFAIKIFYSMYLYEGFRTSKEIQNQKAKFDKEIISRELLTDNETDYGDILNGNFFNSEYINAAPYENGEVSRCRRVISRKAIPKDDKDYKEKTEIERKIYDFFILTTSFVFDSKEKPEDTKNKSVFSNYRKKEEVYYERTVGEKRKFVCFDVLSIFYNLLDIEKTYKRYNINIEKLDENGNNQIGKSISYIAEKNDKIKSYFEKFGEKDKLDGIIEKETKAKCRINMSPLYKEILDYQDTKINKRYPSEIAEEIAKDEEIKKLFDNLYFWKEDNLLYRLNVRNLELLEQISYKLQRERPNGNSDNIGLLKEMFKTLSEFTIKTYEGSGIDYKFFEAIHTFLDELSKNKKMKKIFDNIYIEKKVKSKTSPKTKQEKNPTSEKKTLSDNDAKN